MVGIHDTSRVYQIHFFIHLIQTDQIFVMVVRDGNTAFVYCTTQNDMGERVTGCVNFPSAVYKMMRMLCSVYRVQHNRKVTTGRIFHTAGNIKTADGQTMLLILNRTCTDGYIGEQIIDVIPVFRVKHLICCRQTGFFDSAQMQFTNSDQSCNHIRFCLRIRLCGNSFVSFTGSTWFVCIDTWNDDQFVFGLLIDFGKSVDVIHNRFFLVSGAGSDDNKEFVGFPAQNTGNLRITLLFDLLAGFA